MDASATPTPAVLATDGTGHDALLLLLLGGGLALGLPRITARARRRFWHPWINNGLLPLLVGIALGPTMSEWLSNDASRSLRPLLGLVLAAGGVLIGTQLRWTYLHMAGRALWPLTGRAGIQFFVAFAPLALAASTGLPLDQALGCAGLVGAVAVASSQRPPPERLGSSVTRADLTAGHTGPCGWWNIIALAGGALALSFGFHSPEPMTAPSHLLTLLLPMGLGLACGWAAVQARDADELYLFLLAVLALSGGLAIAVQAVPMFFGILVGAVLVNVAARRSGGIEQTLEDLEQPIAVSSGLLAGLCIAAAEPVTWPWLMCLLLILVRWWVRSRISPTVPQLGLARDRMLAPPGAAGVLLVGCAVLAPAPAPQLAAPLAVTLGLLTLVSEWSDRVRAAPIAVPVAGEAA